MCATQYGLETIDISENQQQRRQAHGNNWVMQVERVKKCYERKMDDPTEGGD